MVWYIVQNNLLYFIYVETNLDINTLRLIAISKYENQNVGNCLFSRIHF